MRLQIRILPRSSPHLATLLRQPAPIKPYACEAISHSGQTEEKLALPVKRRMESGERRTESGERRKEIEEPEDARNRREEAEKNGIKTCCEPSGAELAWSKAHPIGSLGWQYLAGQC